jgi:tetratricopeptide (TPR) repeat protein
MDRKRSNSLQVFRLVFDEEELNQKVALVLDRRDTTELEELCAPWSNTQRLQVVSRLLLKRELESALSLLCLFPTHSRRVAELKLQALMDLERFEEAESQATKILAEDPDCSVTREKRMVCRRKLGRRIEELSDKIFLLEKIGADAFRIHTAYLLRGSKFLRIKELDKAEEDLCHAERHLARTADSLALRGKLAYEFGDYQVAIGYLTCSLDLDDSRRLFTMTSLLTERSLAQQKMGRYQLALADLDRALPLETRSEVKAWLLWMRANLFQKMGEKDKAIKDLSRGLVLDPSNVHIKIMHGKLIGKGFKHHGHAPESEDPWQSIFSVALSLYTQGEFQAALDELDKLESEAGDDLQIRFWKAQIYLSKGDLKKGQELRKALAAEALVHGKVMLWAWATDLDWRCRLDGLWQDRS